ncbi:MAG: regulatory protein RecX [Succinivibrionaceae bacterium]|nr:regulatory protein RecX [Succinivibrionaceae bacterium]
MALDEQTDLKKAVNFVLVLVAKREYSESQIRQKLSARYSPEVAGAAMDYCVSHEYVSDLRYAQSYIRSRIRSSYGWERIRYELAQKGVARELAEECRDRILADLDCDFEQICAEYMQRRFGTADLKDRQVKLKIMRHMAARGFGREEISCGLARLGAG